MNDKGNEGPPRSRRTATKLVTAGRDPKSYYGFVNPPVYHASTVLYPTAEDFLAHRARYQYGRRGTPTTEALELALQELEGPQCAGVVAVAVGTGGDFGRALAVGRAVPAIIVLVTDSAYGPTRNFCGQILVRLGVTTTYYDPASAAALPNCCSRTPAPSIWNRRVRCPSKCRMWRRSPKPRTPMVRWC